MENLKTLNNGVQSPSSRVTNDQYFAVYTPRLSIFQPIKSKCYT